MDSLDSIAPTISVVVPVYNSAASLDELTQRLLAVLDQVATCSEIILVNDGSRDRSWEVIDALASKDQVKAYTAMRTAAGHMQMIADPLAEAIVKQFPDKFGG